ncbi:hypothetical protein SPAB_00035 [Salmonella enterica subsp. enterica serovar Paratyphi B str. SPB7]|uniref:Uncharacterized protein n=1 Tax=Salmonella paratyphi B (strain ATCC BAA-1250 / SPB7) TaxID=1016998 RepID=A0A6C6YXD2_SALPB|nr:hypothetical protein SPAB_00035 [Salmonella enterica subsp. enterica serovar Paratyphi B str. SPB7]
MTTKGMIFPSFLVPGQRPPGKICVSINQDASEWLLTGTLNAGAPA